MGLTKFFRRSGNFILVLLFVAALLGFILLLITRGLLRPDGYVSGQAFRDSDVYDRQVQSEIEHLMHQLEPPQAPLEAQLTGADGRPQSDELKESQITRADGPAQWVAGKTQTDTSAVANASPSDTPSASIQRPTQFLDKRYSSDYALKFWYWSQDPKDAPLSNKLYGNLSYSDVVANFDQVYDFRQMQFYKGEERNNKLSMSFGSYVFHGLLAFSIDWPEDTNHSLTLAEKSYAAYVRFGGEITLGLSLCAALVLLLSALWIARQTRQARLGPEAARSFLQRLPVDLLFGGALLSLVGTLSSWHICTSVLSNIALKQRQLDLLEPVSFSPLVNLLVLPLTLIGAWVLALALPFVCLLGFVLILIRRYSANTLHGPWAIKAWGGKLWRLWLRLFRAGQRAFGLSLAFLIENSSRRKLVFRIALYFGLLLLLVLLSGHINLRNAVPLILLLSCLPVLLFGLHQWRSLGQIDNLCLQLKRFRSGVFDIPEPPANCPSELRKLSLELQDIGSIIKDAVEERSKSERMKSELITNVSHDLRTPLTSIINYIDLLKQEPPASEQAAEYIQVLDAKSARLRQLTEDLIEASKAMSGNLKLLTEEIALPELLRQEAGEYSQRFAEKRLELVLRLPEERDESAGRIVTDPRHLSRILDNLLNNASKYALSGSRVYLSLRRDTVGFYTEMKNIAEHPPARNVDELFERFTRGDLARGSAGGASSGLGLSIAKSLSELLGGRLDIHIDDDLFTVRLFLPHNKAVAEAEGGMADAEPLIATPQSPLAALSESGYHWFRRIGRHLKAPGDKDENKK